MRGLLLVLVLAALSTGAFALWRALQPDPQPPTIVQPIARVDPIPAPRGTLIGGSRGGSCLDGWCWESPLPDGLPVRALWGSSSTDVWAAGAALRRWDGTRWSAVAIDDPPFIGWFGLHGCSDDDVWLVGGRSVMHFDGATWSSVAAGSPAIWLGVWCRAKDDVWLIGSRGALRHFDGSAWSKVPSHTTALLMRIFARTPDDAWITGGAGTVLHFDGRAWSSRSTAALRATPMPHREGSLLAAMVPRSMFEAFSTVWSGAEDDAWIGGYRGLFHWNGSEWSESKPASSDRPAVSALFGFASDDVWVGRAGKLSHWDGRAWTAVGAPGRSVDAIWGASASDVWFARNILERWNGGAIQPATPGSAAVFWTAWASSSTDAWAAGDDGVIAHLVDDEWRRVDAGLTTEGFRSIWASGPDDVWFRGSSKTVRWDGHVLAVVQIRDQQQREVRPFDGFARARNDYWICGSDGLFRFDGAVARRIEELDQLETEMRSCDSVWGAGDRLWVIFGRSVWHHDGVRWTRVRLPKHAELNRVTGSDIDDVWIDDEDGALFHFDGRRWSRTPVHASAGVLTGVHAVSPHEAWAWGFDRRGIGAEDAALVAELIGVAKVDRSAMSRDVLLRWNGSAWSSVPAPDDVLGIGGGAGSVWSVGRGILRLSAR